jgi:DNA polymerase-3 subunit epsilon
MKAFPEVFSIIDVETSGLRPASSRIIDIGIIRVEHGKVVEKYQTLVNPGMELPSSIEYLTGIRSEDLYNAPSFEEIAIDVESLLNGAVFVAHNASFDYRFIQSEFQRIGKNFTAQRLCTVRLSRILYPKARGHSLDAVMARHGIRCSVRHRALPDAQVLLDFFTDISKSHEEGALREKIDLILGGAIRDSDALIRPGVALQKTAFKELPESAGVYMFYGADDELLYIGKSKHVRTRARSHFHASDSRKEQYIQQETTNMQAISTSGELSALLLESALIKQEAPMYNRALRKRKLLIIARREIGEGGYAKVVLSRTETIHPEDNILGVFKTVVQAKVKLKELAKQYLLCTKLLGIETASGACFGSQIGTCDGACMGKVSPEVYNVRVEEAFAARKVRTWPYKGAVLITEQDHEDSGSVFFIKDWVLMGSFKFNGGEFEPLLPGSNTFDYDHYKILARYLLNAKNKKSITVLSDSDYRRQLALCTGSYEESIV